MSTPLSILHVGEWLRSQGNQVRYCDLRTDYFASYYSQIAWADIVGFSAMTGYQCKRVEMLAKEIKKEFPNKKIILGGFHAKSGIPINEKYIDEVWTENYSLDRAPFNRYTRKYYMSPYLIQYFSSDGCWGRCRFCCLKQQWTPRPIEQVKRDLNRILKQTKQKFVYFGDPNIGGNLKRIEEIGKIFKKYNAHWHCNIRPDTLSQKMVDALDGAQCTSIEIGCESGNDHSLKNIISKGFKSEVIVNAARRLAKTNISCMYSFMANYPGETRRIRRDTINLINKIHRIDKKARVSIYSYMPLPDTEMYDEVVANKKFTPPKNLADWGSVSMGSDPIYWICGLRFRKDNTRRNFPGFKRLKILPYEILAHMLWYIKILNWFPYKRIAELIKKQLK